MASGAQIVDQDRCIEKDDLTHRSFVAAGKLQLAFVLSNQLLEAPVADNLLQRHVHSFSTRLDAQGAHGFIGQLRIEPNGSNCCRHPPHLAYYKLHIGYIQMSSVIGAKSLGCRAPRIPLPGSGVNSHVLCTEGRWPRRLFRDTILP